MNKLIHRLRSQDGFTLIELLIVIIILGVLAAIVVFAVGAFSDRGDAAACKADKKTVEVAQEAHKAKNSVYASSVQELKDEDYIREVPAGVSTNVTGTVTTTRGC